MTAEALPRLIFNCTSYQVLWRRFSPRVFEVISKVPRRYLEVQIGFGGTTRRRCFHSVQKTIFCTKYWVMYFSQYPIKPTVLWTVLYPGFGICLFGFSHTSLTLKTDSFITKCCRLIMGYSLCTIRHLCNTVYSVKNASHTIRIMEHYEAVIFTFCIIIKTWYRRSRKTMIPDKQKLSKILFIKMTSSHFSHMHILII